MTELWVADSGVRQLHARFTDAVWRQDKASLAECVALDAEWKIAGMHLRGREEISTTMTKLLGYCRRIRLIIGDTLLDVSDGAATGRVPVTEFSQLQDGSPVLTMGIYFDHYVQRGERWCYRRRHFGLHYRGPMDLSGEFIAESPDFGAPPGMPGLEEPTITRRKAE
jgi:hypothetical protein